MSQSIDEKLRLRLCGPARLKSDLKSIESMPHVKFVMKDEKNMDVFLVLLKCIGDRYRDQYHILEFIKKYSYGNTYKMYPLDPPLVRFLTKIYHPNVSEEGGICVDILKDSSKWSKEYKFDTVIRSIEALLEDPNNSSPFNGKASSDWVRCERLYKQNDTKKLSQEACDELKNSAFKDFDKISFNIANKNSLNKYYKWFPELEDYEDYELCKKFKQL